MFVPGIGHLAARRRAQGVLLLFSFVVLLGAAALAATAVDRPRLIGLGLQPRSLQIAMTLAITLGLTWVFVVLSSYAVTRPRVLSQAQKVVGGMAVVVLAAVAATPFAMGARYAYVQHDLVTSLFKDSQQFIAGGDGISGADFVGKPRVNVLLLGGDAGKGREGVRTDSMTLASVDTKTGETVLISLPRNLQKVQFEPGTTMAERFQNGFDDMLNAVYRYGEDNPDVVPGAQHSGGELMKQTFTHVLGVQVDYFVLVNLDGFKGIVDALGGVEINVQERIPVGGQTTTDGDVVVPPSRWIEPGLKELDGEDALWYGRSRLYSDDYTRMARQRCLLGAIARQADPLTVLTRFQQLASATKEVVLTDIPQQALSPLTQLAMKGKNAKITSLQFVRSSEFSPSNPDYDYIQEKVAEALTKDEPTADAEATPGGASSDGSPSGGGSTSGRGGTGDTATPPKPPAGESVSLDEVCG
jgi:LCP family protein required for cell wall assembly